MAWNDLLIRDAVFSLVTGPAATVYAGLGALVVRRARNPIGWFLLGDGGFLAIMALSPAYAVRGVSHPGTLPGDPSNPVTTVAYLAVPVLALFGLPAVLTLAILKHGLYQIDVILNRAVKYGLLSASLTAVYAGIVLGIGTLAGYAGGPVLTVAAAVVIAVLFQPARARAQHVANRLIYGPRATPYQVLADFAEDMAGQLDVDVTLDRMAPVLAAAIGADRVDLWVRVGGYLNLRASWPPGSARGIYPPLLADEGLAAAVRGQADRAPLPVRVEADGIGRHPPDVEAATYFCVLEALQNVAKYAHASQATIVLSDQDGHLRFSVTDDGSGFDATTTTHGTGLQGTADRLAVVPCSMTIRA